MLAAIHASVSDKSLICPAAQSSEASWAGQLGLIAAPDLLALLAHLKGRSPVPAPEIAEAEVPEAGPICPRSTGMKSPSARGNAPVRARLPLRHPRRAHHADLAGAEQVGRIHIAEALSYCRPALRN